MKKLIIFMLIANISTLFSQESTSYFNSKIDSLQKILMENPNDINSTEELIDSYMLLGKPELALIEIINLQRSGINNSELNYKKNEILFWLGQKKVISKDLVIQYLSNPNYSNNYFLAILDYSEGNKKRAVNFLRTLIQENGEDKICNKLANAYKQLFSSGNTDLALSTSELVKEYDRDIYEKLFPSPKITLVSPENEDFIQDKSANVVFLVNHTKPVKSIKINGEEIFRNGPNANSTKSFARQFSHNVSLTPGENIINITADDFLGYSSFNSLKVFSGDFTESGCNNSITDSVRYFSKVINNFIIKDSIQVTKDPLTKTIVLSNDNNDAICSLIKELLINNISGYVEKNNLQTLSGEQAKYCNLSKIFNNWVTKDLTLRTKLIFAISTPIIIDSNDIIINTKNAKISLLGLFNNLRNKSFRSLNLIIVDNRTDKIAEIKRLLANVLPSMEINILLINREINIPEFIRFFFEPYSLDKYTSEFISSLQEVFPPSFIRYDGVIPQQLVCWVGRKISNKHDYIKRQLEKKLITEKLTSAQKEKIIRYASNWERYTDIVNYLNNKINVNELYIRANEYLNRKERSK